MWMRTVDHIWNSKNERLNLGVSACASWWVGKRTSSLRLSVRTVNLRLSIWLLIGGLLGVSNLRLNIGTWSWLLRYEDWSSRVCWGILGREGRIHLNDLSSVNALGSEIDLCNVLGPDTGVSTYVLPEGQGNNSNTVDQHCLNIQEKIPPNKLTSLLAML